MKQRKRIYYSAEQRSEIWDRWRRGESMSSIGRRFDRESSSVFSVLSPSGGIRPAERRRSARGAEPGRARGGLQRPGRGAFAPGDRRPARPGAIDDQPGSRTERWAGRVSGDAVRSGGMVPCVAPQALQAGLPSGLAPNSIGEAAPQLVARADRGLDGAQLRGPSSTRCHTRRFTRACISRRAAC